MGSSGDQPFDFTAAMRLVCADVCERMPDFAHIRMDHVAVSFAQARSNVLHGLQAKLTPLRFENGALITRRGSTEWTIQRVYSGEVEILYILTFYLPRFFQHSFREKLVTVFHELYHIGPRFNGDIRRMEGRYHVHSHSQHEYDEHMGELVDDYLSNSPPDEILQFLRLPFKQFLKQYGGVVGLKVPIPKMLRVTNSQDRPRLTG